jgi:endonuclease/exonuclease/phosphatase family metal-dependent hydrolase
MEHVFGANLDRDPLEPGAPRRQFGTAILSALPVLHSQNIALPRASTGSEQRGLLVCDVELPGGARFRLLGTHLSVSAQDRALQVEAILTEASRTDGPHALLGDLNARPTAPELAPLFAGLRDAWTLAGDGEGFTFPVTDPSARIDYVLVSEGIAVRTVRVPGGGRAGRRR